MRHWLSVLLIACALVSLTACGGSANLSGSTRDFDFIVSPGYIERIQLPVEFEIEETDNNVYWKFTNGTQFFVKQPTDITTSKLDSEYGVYTTRDSIIKQFTEKDFEVMTEPKYMTVLKQALSESQSIEVPSDLDKSSEILELPAYEDKSSEMNMSAHNLYMPAGVRDTMVNIYVAELICNKDKWLETWVVDGNFDDIQSYLFTLVCANSGVPRAEGWYLSDAIFYAKAGDNAIVAKKIRTNEWYIYYGSNMYLDYMLTGANKVHAS